MREVITGLLQRASVAAKRSLASNDPTIHGSPAALALRILAYGPIIKRTYKRIMELLATFGCMRGSLHT
jgi:hypothetical protein